MRSGLGSAQRSTSLWRQVSERRPLSPRPQCLLTSSRTFSHSTHQNTRLRKSMFDWLGGPGAVFREPLPGSTNYLGAYDKRGRLLRARGASRSRESEDEGQEAAEEENDDEADKPAGRKISNSKPLPREGSFDLRPFPMNPHFRSQPVLDEDMREEIYNRVIRRGKSVRVVSAELGVEMNRVGAVVRLKEIERRWRKEGKPLAIPYAKAVLAMLPKTNFGGNSVPHESINDLPTHPATRQQIFHLTSESRAFTRVDAAKVFYPGLLPADARIPHPELIQLERERQAGIPREERIANERQRIAIEEEKRATAERKKKEWEERTLKKVLTADEGGQGGRWEWHVKDISVQDVGKDGRAWKGVGWRYGVPHQDRKRGEVKIPTRVV